MVKVANIFDGYEAWQYPAPELASPHAMPPWLAEIAALGGTDDLIITDTHGEHRAKPGDWIIRLSPVSVHIVDEKRFSHYWRLL